MASYTAVDLSQLPFPDAVEVIDYEVILAEMLDDFQTRMGVTFSAPLESDPSYKILEVAAYREVLLRQRVNEAIKALCLAYALGADLDQIGARYNVERLLIQAADPDAVPPTEDVFEGDEDYRRRIQLSFESYSTAGPSGAYKYHALSADPDVLDASVKSVTPGEVTVTVLSRTGSGVPAGGVLTNVTNALNAETVRPLCDTVVVQAATIVNYAVTATLYLFPGPDPLVVEDAAQAAVEAYAAESHRCDRSVTLSGLYAALHRPGVQRVVLTSPVADVDIAYNQASWCTAITLTTAASVD